MDTLLGNSCRLEFVWRVLGVFSADSWLAFCCFFEVLGRFSAGSRQVLGGFRKIHGVFAAGFW